MARHRHWDEGDEEFRTEDIDFGDDEPAGPVDDEGDDGESLEIPSEDDARAAGNSLDDTAEETEQVETRKGRRRSSRSASARKSASSSSSSRRSRKTSSSRRKKSESAEDEEDRTERLEVEVGTGPTEESAVEQSTAETLEPAAEPVVAGSGESEEEAGGLVSESEEVIPVGAAEPSDCAGLPPDNDQQIQALRRLGCRVDLDAHGHVWRIFLYERNKDNALAMIHDFPCLKEVWLFGARVTAPMVEKFRELHPHVNVYI